MSEQQTLTSTGAFLDQDEPAETPAAIDASGQDLRSRVLAYEKALILSALAASGGHQRRAAELLGVLPTTLHEKLKRHGLRPLRKETDELD